MTESRESLARFVIHVWLMYCLLSARWTLQRFHTVARLHYLHTYWYMHFSSFVIYMLCCKSDGMLWQWQGEMKAFCEICNLHFVSDADLNRHNRYHHMSKYDGTAEERTFLSATAELTTTTHRHITLKPQQVNKWLNSKLIMYYIGWAKKIALLLLGYNYESVARNHEISH